MTGRKSVKVGPSINSFIRMGGLIIATTKFNIKNLLFHIKTTVTLDDRSIRFSLIPSFLVRLVDNVIGLSHSILILIFSLLRFRPSARPIFLPSHSSSITEPFTNVLTWPQQHHRHNQKNEPADFYPFNSDLVVVVSLHLPALQLLSSADGRPGDEKQKLR